MTTTAWHNIVVGISGAPADEAALAWALDECVATGARLTIAHACTHDFHGRSSTVDGHPGLGTAVAAARRALTDRRVDVQVQPPPAGAMLTGLAEGADLLVVGQPRRSRWSHWGSTTPYVTRHAPGPVVVARPVGRTGATFAGHVVVGVDGSEAADAALAFGFAYAAARRLALAAVAVSHQPTGDVWYDDRFLEEHLASDPAALTMLSEHVTPWEHRYPDLAVKRAVYVGRAADGLLRAAESARLLVVGAPVARPGRTGLSSSTALDIVDRAAGPVAVVPYTWPATTPAVLQEVPDVRP